MRRNRWTGDHDRPKIGAYTGCGFKNDQHLKCDYSVTPEIFSPNCESLFSRVLSINVLSFLKLLYVGYTKLA